MSFCEYFLKHFRQIKNIMEQKTMKCTKCHKDTAVQDGINKPNGFICNDCIKKRKTTTVVIVCCILLLVLIALVIYLSTSKEKNAIGFDGVENIQDSVSVTVQEPEVDFILEQAVAQANPVSAGQTIDNIESFKRVFTENIQKAKKLNNGSIIIPNINILFHFNSCAISSAGNELLEAYAKAYLQTNKEAILLVEGFACNIGSDNVNNRISEQRAKAVKNILVSYGISENKIETCWYGKSRNKEFSYSNMEDYRRCIISIK